MRRLSLLAAVCLSIMPCLGSGSTLESLEVEISNLFKKVNPTVVTVKHSRGSGTFKEIVSTGVIIDRKGHIITMRDLPSDPEKAEIVLSNGEKRVADFIGYDPESKIQILKAKDTGLSPPEIGNPGATESGSWVFIVGNSYGVSPSLSTGHISGKREDDLIQLSGELTPGMGGAGVYNTRGELIGIVSATISRPFYLTLGGVEGRLEIRKGMDLPSPGPGLVLPIDRAMKIAGEIIERGKVEHGWLGVYIRDVDEDLKEELNIKEGVLVTRLAEGSPAEKAGMEEEDVIIEYEGKKTRDVETLRKLVSDTDPGKKVKVTVLREGKRKTLIAEIGKKTWEEKEGFYPFEFLPYLKESFEGPQIGFDTEKLKKELKKLKEDLKELKEELKGLKKEKI